MTHQRRTNIWLRVVAALSIAGVFTCQDAGTEPVNLVPEARDAGELTAEQGLGVTAPNRSPGPVSTISDTTVVKGEEIAVDVSPYFDDPDGDTLAYTATSSSPATATTTVSGEKVTVTGKDVGTATITVIASDPGGLAARQRFDVTVGEANRSPRPVSRIPDTTVVKGKKVGVDVSPYFDDPDGDTLAYTATSSRKATATVAVSEEKVSVTGKNVGKATITVIASDPGGLTARRRFNVTVRAANRSPRPVSSIPDTTVVKGKKIGVDVSPYFDDPDGDTLVYRATSSRKATATVAVSEEKVTVTGKNVGKATITVIASDPGGLTGRRRFNVTVRAPNRSPRPVSTIPDTTAVKGEEIAVDVSPYFTDPDGDDLIFAAESSDDHVATAGVDGKYLAVTAVDTGAATVTATATDAAGLNATQSFTVTVSLPNRAPQPGDRIHDVYVVVGDQATTNVSNHFTDPDGDDLEFAASSSDAAVATASVSGDDVVVATSATGVATIVVTATDAAGLSATKSIPVLVLAATSNFNISLRFENSVPRKYRSRIEAAASLWMSILAAMELPDVTLNQNIYCTPGHGAHFGKVDDVAIIVYVSELNGGIARASGCRRRSDTFTPIVGFIHFSDDYLDRLVESGKLTEIAVHEIAHVLGFGITWDQRKLATGEANPHFTGSQAIAAFNAAGGASYTRPKVPTTSTFDHWPKSVFGPEMMSSTTSLTVRDPLSAVTLAALADMGYVVDLSYAEDFSISNTGLMAADAAPENVIYRGDDVHHGPVVLVDRNGKTVRVIPRSF